MASAAPQLNLRPYLNWKGEGPGAASFYLPRANASIIPDPFSRAAFIPHKAQMLRGKNRTAEAFEKTAESFMLGRIGDDFLNAALCGSPTAGTPLMSLVCSCWHETFVFCFFPPCLSLTDTQRWFTGAAGTKVDFSRGGFPSCASSSYRTSPGVPANALYRWQLPAFFAGRSLLQRSQPVTDAFTVHEVGDDTFMLSAHSPLYFDRALIRKILLLHWELVLTVPQFSAWGSGCLMLGLICRSKEGVHLKPAWSF